MGELLKLNWGPAKQHGATGAEPLPADVCVCVCERVPMCEHAPCVGVGV